MYIKEQAQSVTLKLAKGSVIFLAAVLFSFLVSRIFITPFTVNNNSMEKTLSMGDKVIILKVATPEVGDIILFNSPVEPDKVLLKRIIAKGNNTIELKNKKFYINNKKAAFKWEYNSTDNRIFPKFFTFRDNMPKIKLKNDEFFVIGDNIDNSFDSRTFGIINKKIIIGKMIYKY